MSLMIAKQWLAREDFRQARARSSAARLWSSLFWLRIEFCQRRFFSPQLNLFCASEFRRRRRCCCSQHLSEAFVEKERKQKKLS